MNGKRGLAITFALLGCRAPEELPQQELEPRFEPRREVPREKQPEPPPPVRASTAYLEGALLEASYDTSTLAQLAGGLPQPSQRDTPLVGVFGGIVDALLGDPAERLEAVGRQADARIHLSMRALDGRAAAVRKLLGELAQADAKVEPERHRRLTSEARTLGVHLRASLPTSDRARLLRALEVLMGGETQAKPCASLPKVVLCSARPRLLLWARPEAEDRLRVDAIYLFQDAAAQDNDLAGALERADTWPTRSDAPEFGEPAPIELRIHAESTRELLEAEALADAVLAFDQPTFDYAAYLHQEAALRDLVPSQRVFDGVDLDIHYDPLDDHLTTIVRWLPGPLAPMPELFAPVIERGTLPVLEGDCAAAQVCARVAGIDMVNRFTPLARSAFADSTGAARILRQAGDGGPLLLGLCSWPNLLGTAGTMAKASGGLLSQAQSSLLDGSMGLGLLSLELGDDPAEVTEAPFGASFVGYLRVGPEALDALRQVGMLAGLSLRPTELEGVAAAVERGSYEGATVYLVDEASRPGGFGGWLIAADADERVGWLLETPREPAEPSPIDPLWYLRIASLGPLAAREQLAHVEDPPIRAWLDGRSLELRGRFVEGSPMLQFELGPIPK